MTHDPRDAAAESALPIVEFAFPGPLRDQLVGAILAGAKTTTASLREEYAREGAALPAVGAEEVVVDSDERPVAVIRTRDVQVAAGPAGRGDPGRREDDDRLARRGRLTDEHARGEGEGYPDAAAWREGHEEFWTSIEFIAALGEPRIAIDDDAEVVCETFEVVRRL
jgi:uncharacterized protein YhfF